MEAVGLVSKTAKGFFGDSGVSIDNWTFKFFYKGSVVLAIFCSVIVTSRQFFGAPISCDPGHAREFVSEEVLESYCWMYADFNIPDHYVGPCSGKDNEDIDGVPRVGNIYNSYYQWVPIYLIFLAVLFYLPRCMWLVMEGGLMKFFGKGTTTRFIEDPEEKRDKLVKFFKDNIHNKYNIYYFGFIFCEFLNFLVVCISMYFTHRFLEYRFLFYGFRVWTYYSIPHEEMQTRQNPMCYVFPRIVSCDYHRFGTGGKQENLNAICILALNIINDKVFLVLWWWFILLIFLGFLRLLFRLIQINSVRLRYSMLNLRMHRYFKRSENVKKVRTYIELCSRGDWFVLYQLSKNLNRPFFMDFLVTLARTVDPNPDPDPEDGYMDRGDGVLDLMLKPTLTTYESKEDAKDKDDDDD